MSGASRISEQEAGLAEAMRQALAGDSASYRTLLEGVKALVTVYARKGLARVGIQDDSLVDDLVQEVLLAVHEKRHTYDPSQLFTPWMFAIARYKLIDSWRKRRHEARFADSDALEAALEQPIFSDPSVAGDLEKLLATLPERSREAVRLLKLEGLSVAETASRIGASEASVKVIVHRALKALRGKAEKP